MPDERTALARFRALVMRDAALQETLSAAVDADDFVMMVRDMAAARGLAFDEAAVRAQLRPNPLGLARLTAAPPVETAWPPRPWLPTQVLTLSGKVFVDWAHFGPAPLASPFFEGDLRRALNRPFNCVFGHRMALGDVIAGAENADSLAPSGFIFHMSRCGSTLAAQMLAAPRTNIVVSEAPPIDAIMQLGGVRPSLSHGQHDTALRAIVAACGRRRSGKERHYFVKLDCWHALALPLFRRAFPAVPWVFLYRDPVEVLVSHMREPGGQMIPQLVPPSRYGIDNASVLPGLDYTARVLEKICTAAAEGYTLGGGRLVNYLELPDALFTGIMPHFGIEPREDECAGMRAAARYDAKFPQAEFSSDIDRKRSQATPQLRAVAERHLGPVYRRLEELRRSEPPQAARAGSI